MARHPLLECLGSESLRMHELCIDPWKRVDIPVQTCHGSLPRYCPRSLHARFLNGLHVFLKVLVQLDSFKMLCTLIIIQDGSTSADDKNLISMTFRRNIT